MVIKNLIRSVRFLFGTTPLDAFTLKESFINKMRHTDWTYPLPPRDCDILFQWQFSGYRATWNSWRPLHWTQTSWALAGCTELGVQSWTERTKPTCVEAGWRGIKNAEVTTDDATKKVILGQGHFGRSAPGPCIHSRWDCPRGVWARLRLRGAGRTRCSLGRLGPGEQGPVHHRLDSSWGSRKASLNLYSGTVGTVTVYFLGYIGAGGRLWQGC